MGEGSSAGKKTVFFGHLYIKMIFLPRQARDKHREKTQERDLFLQERKRAAVERRAEKLSQPEAAAAAAAAAATGAAAAAGSSDQGAVATAARGGRGVHGRGVHEYMARSGCGALHGVVGNPAIPEPVPVATAGPGYRCGRQGGGHAVRTPGQSGARSLDMGCSGCVRLLARIYAHALWCGYATVHAYAHIAIKIVSVMALFQLLP